MQVAEIVNALLKDAPSKDSCNLKRFQPREIIMKHFENVDKLSEAARADMLRKLNGLMLVPPPPLLVNHYTPSAEATYEGPSCTGRPYREDTSGGPVDKLPRESIMK